MGGGGGLPNRGTLFKGSREQGLWNFRGGKLGDEVRGTPILGMHIQELTPGVARVAKARNTGNQKTPPQLRVVSFNRGVRHLQDPPLSEDIMSLTRSISY